MRNLAIFTLVIAIGMMQTVDTGQAARGGGGGGARGGGGGGGGGAAGRGGGGFNLSNDAPSSRPSAGAPSGNKSQGGNRESGFNLGNDAPSSRANTATSDASKRTGNTNVNNRSGNTNVSNRTGNTNVSGNTVNKNNVNVSGNNVNVNRNVNVSGNGYGYRGAVVVNPVYRGPAWGWNHGAVWVVTPAYWGGGFWGPFAAGVATAVVMGAIINSANQQTYTSYKVNPGSPGAQLLSNYHLQQVPCGPPNLVVIYGPNSGVICANPNNLVAPGNYAVNVDTLTLQSP